MRLPSRPFARAIAAKAIGRSFHINLANALKNQGKLDEAVASYRRALELKPDFAEVLHQPGQCLEGARQGGRSARLLPPWHWN